MNKILTLRLRPLRLNFRFLSQRELYEKSIELNKFYIDTGSRFSFFTILQVKIRIQWSFQIRDWKFRRERVEGNFPYFSTCHFWELLDIEPYWELLKWNEEIFSQNAIKIVNSCYFCVWNSLIWSGRCNFCMAVRKRKILIALNRQNLTFLFATR